MDYVNELDTVQRWLKSTAGLNSFRRETGTKNSRPVVRLDSPGRSRARHITRYSYVQTVQWFGTLFVNSVADSLNYQEALAQDLENRCGVLEVVDENKNVLTYLKQATIKFTEADSLDVPFSLTYEVCYKRSGWDDEAKRSVAPKGIINRVENDF